MRLGNVTTLKSDRDTDGRSLGTILLNRFLTATILSGSSLRSFPYQFCYVFGAFQKALYLEWIWWIPDSQFWYDWRAFSSNEFLQTLFLHDGSSESTMVSRRPFHRSATVEHSEHCLSYKRVSEVTETRHSRNRSTFVIPNCTVLVDEHLSSELHVLSPNRAILVFGTQRLAKAQEGNGPRRW